MAHRALDRRAEAAPGTCKHREDGKKKNELGPQQNRNKEKGRIPKIPGGKIPGVVKGMTRNLHEQRSRILIVLKIRNH